MTLRARIEARLRQLEHRAHEQARLALDPQLSDERRREASAFGTAYTDLYYWLRQDLEECA